MRTSSIQTTTNGYNPWLLGGLVVLLVGFSYAGGLQNGFTFDDQGIILANPLVVQGDWGQIFTTSYWWGVDQDSGGLYRPLTVATYALNYKLHSTDPLGYHLVNILLHLSASMAVFLGGRVLLGPMGGLLAGLVFGLHPVLSEAVNSGVGRAELLSCNLGLAAVAALWAAPNNPRWALLGLVLLVGAALAKESGAVFGLALALSGLWRQPRLGLRIAVGLGALGLGVGVRWWVTGQLGPGGIGFIDNPLAYAPFLERVLNGCLLLWRYIGLLVLPWPLSPDYSYNQLPVLGVKESVLWVGALAGVGLVAGGGWLAWKKPGARLWLGLSGGSLVLVANIVLPIGTIFAERLLYLPAVGFALGLAWLISRLPKHWPMLFAGAWCLVTLPLISSRTKDWANDLSLFQQAVKTAPHSARAHFGLGRAYHQAQGLDAAMAAYQKALAIYPAYAEAHYNLGAAFLADDQPQRALAAYRRALNYRPTYIPALYANAALSYHLNGPAQTLEPVQRLLQAAPNHLNGLALKAKVLIALGQIQGATATIGRIEVLDPRFGQLALLRRLLEQEKAANK